MHEPISTTLVVTHGAMAFFGGIVHALKAHREKTSKGLLDFCILTLMCTFTGLVFALLSASLFEHNFYVSVVGASVGSYWGVDGLAAIIHWITKKVSK